ncbi:MAG: phosphatase PAP2 family protein [Promethearchaeota archaeon]
MVKKISENEIFSNENETLSNKTIIFILLVTITIIVIGGILLLAGFNMTFCEFFYDNEVMYMIFRAISYLGEDIFLILILAVLFFTYNKQFAKNLTFALLGSYYSNAILKDIFQDPRPWTKREATGFGFPSGHSQNAVATWGYMAYHAHQKKNKALPWIFLIITYLIALSRIIIGVHDLEDVYGGLLYGIAFLVLFIYLEPIVSKKINTLKLYLKLILAISIPIILYITAFGIFPNTELDYGLCSGALMGISVGYLIENEYIKYEPTKLTNKQRIVNLIIGLAITVAIYLVLSLFSVDFLIYRFIKYLILSFLIITLIPWIFTKIQYYI